MNIAIISSIELFLYYICLISILAKLLDAIPKQLLLLASFSLFIPITIVEILCNNNFFIITQTIAQIIEILLAKLCFKKSRLLSIISAYLFLFFINSIAVSCTVFILSINSNLEWVVEIVINLLTTIVCLIICLSNYSKKVKQILALTPKAIKRLLLLLLCLCCVLVVLIIYSSFYENINNWTSAVKTILVIFIILLSVAAPILIIYSMANTHYKKLNNNYEQQINAQAEHYMSLSKSNYKLRRFKHDYNNMCIGLSKLIAEGKNEAALKILGNSNMELNTTIKFDTGNGIVDALLTDKQNKANKINVQIEFEGSISPDKIKPTDLCVIFGNTIDNALEACEKMDVSINKVISVSSICNSGFMFIKIVNPVSQKVETQGNIPETTKIDKTAHGFGLHSLEQVVKHYNGNLKLTCDSDNFQVDIDLCIIDK